jgi:hypothetical protein
MVNHWLISWSIQAIMLLLFLDLTLPYVWYRLLITGYLLFSVVTVGVGPGR